MIKIRSIAHKLNPRRAWRWFDALPGWQKAVTTLSIALAVLAMATTAMWIRLNGESKARCDSILVVSSLFQDVGKRQSPPDPDLFDAYVQLKAYASNHPDRLGAVFLVKLLENSFTTEGPATPTAQLLQDAGKELERACQR